MNKRQAKKNLKKIMTHAIRNGRKEGMGIIVKTQDFVDKNGKSCSPYDEDARFIHLKRARIIKYKKNQMQKLHDIYKCK